MLSRFVSVEVLLNSSVVFSMRANWPSASIENLLVLLQLIKISKKTKRIALSNIIFAALTKVTFLTLGALGITGMLFAVFADVGVTLLAILNSLRVLVFKLENKKVHK